MGIDVHQEAGLGREDILLHKYGDRFKCLKYGIASLSSWLMSWRGSKFSWSVVLSSLVCLVNVLASSLLFTSSPLHQSTRCSV